MDTYNPVPGVMEHVPAENDYKGGFSTALMLAELGLAQDMAARSSCSTPLGTAARDIYKTVSDAGYSGKDFSAVFEFISGLERKQ